MKENETFAILIIEDDTDLRLAMTLALRMAGFNVVTADNGMEGLDVVERVRPALILLDMHMPLMDGREFVTELRMRGHLDTPVVFVTASMEVRKAAEEVGAAAWIKKPFALASLIGTVKKHVRQTVREG